MGKRSRDDSIGIFGASNGEEDNGSQRGKPRKRAKIGSGSWHRNGLSTLTRAIEVV